MKKVITTDIVTGAAMPIKSGTLDHLQSAHIETTGAVLRAINSTNPLIGLGGVLYGCNIALSGFNWSITEGAVFYNNEVFFCDAANGILAGAEVVVGTTTTTFISAANYDPTEFSDASSHNVHAVRKIVWSSGASGSGTANYTAFENLRMGRSIAFPYDSAYLTAFAGTWTIASSSFWDVKYIVLNGAAVLIDFEIYDGSNSASTPLLQLDMPFKSYGSFHGTGSYTFGGGSGHLRILAGTGDNRLYLAKGDGTNWAITAGTLAVRGQIILPLISTV